MKKYIGAKVINAEPMSREEYNDYRGWDLPADEGLTFGLAIKAMKLGHRVARKVWNGNGMFVVYIYTSPRKVIDRTAKWIGDDTPLDSQGYIAMFTATKQWQPGWFASQADILAEDWQIVE